MHPGLAWKPTLPLCNRPTLGARLEGSELDAPPKSFYSGKELAEQDRPQRERGFWTTLARKLPQQRPWRRSAQPHESQADGQSILPKPGWR